MARTLLGFTCPRCGMKNAYPRTGTTEGGTDVAYCNGCPTEVSMHLLADRALKADEARQSAIMKWAGWDREGGD